MSAQRRTRNEVGLENTLLEKWWLKGAQNKKVRAQRHTRNEVGLKNALPKRC